MSYTTPIDAKAFANLLLDWADGIGASVSPMKIQKLVYYCHADFLVATGAPLIAQDFEAWEYGPVIPSLFQEFKQFGANAISSRAKRFDPITAMNEVAPTLELTDLPQLVRESFNLYINLSASTLSKMSHVSDGPWNEALRAFNKGQNMGRRISNQLIHSHHRPQIQDSLH